jgi:hypothetical protein
MRVDAQERAARLETVRKISPYFDTVQAAFYLGITASRLERMRHSGTGPNYRQHGRFVRYHVDDLDSWSKAHETKTRQVSG